MLVLSSPNGHGHSNVNSWLWGEFHFTFMSSIRDVAGAHTRFETLHQFLKLYTWAILFSRVPGLAIPSAFEMHLQHLPRKTQHPPQPKVAYLSPGPRGCPGNKDVVPDATGETSWGLPLISIPYLHEQVAPPQQVLPADTGTHASITCLYWSSSVRVGK